MAQSERKRAKFPDIPDKRYFTISEVSSLCRVKNHVLRYWEQVFQQLNPVRRGNRRYYRRSDIVLIRKIRCLLYDHRFTIEGAHSQLDSFDDLKAINRRPEKADYQQVIRQTIVELEELLQLLNHSAVPS